MFINFVTLGKEKLKVVQLDPVFCCHNDHGHQVHVSPEMPPTNDGPYT